MGSLEEQRRQRGYFVRLGSLSTRLRHLAYEHSLGKLRQSRHHTQDTLARLQEALELVRVRGGTGRAGQVARGMQPPGRAGLDIQGGGLGAPRSLTPQLGPHRPVLARKPSSCPAPRGRP